MKVLVVYHHDKKDIGSLQDILEQRGFEIEYLYAADDKMPDYEPSNHDLAIVMGGSMGVYESDEHPYLLNEINYLKKRLAADLPTLGICLGGQLMAKALGGRVYKGANDKETGWREINVNEQGMQTSLKYLDASLTKITQGHQDTFDLPEGTILLASSNQYKNQAFSYKKKAFALQFHPELDEDLIGVWLNKKDDFLTTATMSKEKIAKDTQIYIETMKSQTAKFFKAWLDNVMDDKNA